MEKHYRHENDCLNCGTILEGKFCHNCGQENLQIKESFGHMMNHAISDYFHFDHQFFHTLKPLLFKPGYLTNEYMAGKRVQYLHPVKMYIFISLVYFLLLFKSGHQVVKINPAVNKPVTTSKRMDSVNTNIAKDHNIGIKQKQALQLNAGNHGVTLNKVSIKKIVHRSSLIDLSVDSRDSTYADYLASQHKLAPAMRDGLFTSLINKRVFEYKEKYGSRAGEVFLDEVQHNTPKMMFLMLPLFALILSITFRKNKKYYVEHFIYSFHLHCFIFIFLAITMLLEMLIPARSKAIVEWIDVIGMLYILWYVYKSLRTVYQRSWFRTITKMVGMYIIYLAVFVFCICVVLLGTVMMAV